MDRISKGEVIVSMKHYVQFSYLNGLKSFFKKKLFLINVKLIIFYLLYFVCLPYFYLQVEIPIT